MSQNWIDRAVKTLGSTGGAESPLAPSPVAPDRVDAVFEAARSRVRTRVADGDGSAVSAARAALAAAVMEEGRQALAEVARKGALASLSETQMTGLEAIIRLTGRPSYLVQDGTCAVPSDEWAEDFQVAQNSIDEVIARVGRVNVPELGGAGYQGTGFLVAPDLVMTNRHVALKFAEPKSGGWGVRAGLKPSVDFKREHERPQRLEYEISEIVLVHADPLVDLALLRIDPASGPGPLPQPLRLGADEASIVPRRRAYVIGYPAYDDRNSASAIDQIFGDIFFVKRIAPGEVLALSASGIQLSHDCSTLGGNSGSCLVDFGTHRVIGLHYSGDFQFENRAANLPRLREDPLLANRGLVYA